MTPIDQPMTSIKDARVIQAAARTQQALRAAHHDTPHEYNAPSLPPVDDAANDEEEYYDADDGEHDTQTASYAGGVDIHPASEQAPTGEAGEASDSGAGGDPQGVAEGDETRKRDREEATDAEGIEERASQRPRQSGRVAAIRAQKLQNLRADYGLSNGSQHYHRHNTRLNADTVRLSRLVEELSTLTEGTHRYNQVKHAADQLRDEMNNQKSPKS